MNLQSRQVVCLYRDVLENLGVQFVQLHPIKKAEKSYNVTSYTTYLCDLLKRPKTPTRTEVYMCDQMISDARSLLSSRGSTFHL